MELSKSTVHVMISSLYVGPFCQLALL